MADLKKYEKDTELWESRSYGASIKHAARVSDAQAKSLDDALGLQLLSFRIQKTLIAKLKNIAKEEGIGYQPLMRQVLTKYVRQYEVRQAGQNRNKHNRKK